jgi:LAGLIDADG-like domain
VSLDFVEIEGLEDGQEIEDGPFEFGEDDWLLYALLTDPVFMPELLWRDPQNRKYAGCYRVRDYQYQLNRCDENYAIFACGRSVGKTESEKVHAQIHGFDGDSEAESLLITAPELIHLLPVADAIEDNIRDCRLLNEMLETAGGQTGFTHRPFGVNWRDGTKVVGRIPKITGTGVKAMHQRKLIIEEGQDYPERGWTEVNEAQPLDARVLTPRGSRRMGDLKVGDYVLGSDGRPTLIVGEAHQGEREVLRMRFSDGSVVECDGDHLWTVTCNRHAGKFRTLRAREIEHALQRSSGFGSLKQPWYVPRQGVAEFEGEALPLDPYLLGLLLGDGSLRNGSVTFSTRDEELVWAIRALLDPAEELIYVERCDYRVRRRQHGWRPVPLRQSLIDLGCWGKLAHEKAVPREYLVADARARLELLRGLVDTDGHVRPDGAVVFSSSSLQLADDVSWLVHSLGGVLRRHETPDKRGFRTMHIVRFRLPFGVVPARLQRKAHASTITTDSMRRNIIRVDRIGRKPMKCIAVAAPDGLYLTEDFVVTHNTVNYDSVDRDGNPSFRFWIYGVHGGNKASGFDERARSRVWRKIQVTALMRHDWNRERKENAIAAYGGSSSPDYRRNILGEPGAGASQYFVTSRVMACTDQRIDRPPDMKGSRYNNEEYVKETFRFEEMEGLGISIADALDLPEGDAYETVWGGVDIGLTDSPTVISLFADGLWEGKRRRALIRRFTLERFRPKEIRTALFTIGWHFGTKLAGLGIDTTGLGLPLFQDMHDDELAPQHLLDVSVGYTFNSTIPVEVDPKMCTESNGIIRDQYGSMVKREEDELTGDVRYIAMMPFIAASTRALREMVDSTKLLLPFDTDVIGDMLGETKQRVERIGSRTGQGTVKKGDRFHILDSFRVMAIRTKADEITEKLAQPEQRAVLDVAM